MSHDETLKLLFPIDLAGAHGADLEIEAASLNTVQQAVETLAAEMFPPGAYWLLERWEQVYGLSVSADDPLQARRNRVLQKMRELGGVSIPYFIQLAAGMGFTIIIDELKPLMAGWMAAGDECMSINGDGTSNADWCWRVYVINEPGYWFRAGESAAGEALSYSYHAELETVLNDLKPADTYVDFTYL